ncbi:MAG TPA: exopolysaccharide Pel transporter PelG [Candidatus Wallbacteria bacterium]|nr:MAG: hypothetical protein BWY32_03334 [bacterium ADurb.Bin243]HOD39898.1 exopolysaccharide Pel transporter PelG [Candidatus Wallbacteria bacterium]HPG56212.1 exopolysaccharide Pel transporter PelG [Candidatus Wallbacteria bacterium]
MAGIGFRFRELADSGSYMGAIKSYVFSSIFAAGPWILTMATISTLNALAPPEISGDTLLAFRALLSYIFAFSLILTGTFQLAIVRYIADKIFDKDQEELLSLFIGSSFFFALISIAAGGIFFSYGTAEPDVKLLATMLFCVICLTWNGMAFLTAIKDYKFIIFVFTSGTIASISLCAYLKNYYGLKGYLIGFFLGQLYVFSGITAEITREFFTRKGVTYYFFDYFRSYSVLVFSGLAYNLGIWIDKFVIWNSSHHQVYLGNLKICGVYDLAVFVSYLSIIPSLGYFFVRVETDFYDLYRAYFASIASKECFSKIEERKNDIVKAVDESIMSLVKIQGTITLLCYLNADIIIKRFGGGNELLCAPIYKMAIIGVFFHVLFMFITIFMMYFEFYRALLSANLIFLILNGTLTYIAVINGYNLASGYAAASAASFVFSFLAFKYCIKDLLFYTFVNQPITPALEEKAIFDSFKALEAAGVRNACKDDALKGVNIDDI